MLRSVSFYSSCPSFSNTVLENSVNGTVLFIEYNESFVHSQNPAKSPTILNVSKTGIPHPTSAPIPSPRIRYAAAAAAAIASIQTPSTIAVAGVAAVTSNPTNSLQDRISVVSSSPSLTHPSVASPMLSSAASVSQRPDSPYSSEVSLVVSEAMSSPSSPPATVSTPCRPSIPRKGVSGNFLSLGRGRNNRIFRLDILSYQGKCTFFDYRSYSTYLYCDLLLHFYILIIISQHRQLTFLCHCIHLQMEVY